MPIQTFSPRSPIPAPWRSFFADRGEARSFYFSLPWFQNLDENALEPGTETTIFASEDSSGNPVAAIVCRTPAGQEASSFEGLRPGPNSVAALSNYQTTMFALLTSGDERKDHQALDEIARHLVARKTTALELNLLLPGDRATGQLAESLRAHGQLVRLFENEYMVYENVSGTTFDNYWNSRSSRLRNTHRRRAKQLASLGPVHFEMIQDPADVERGLKLYNEVFRVSWKEPEEFPGFTRGLIRAAAASGALRLGILSLGDRPISAQIWLVSSGVASILKLHFVDLYKDYSTGTICSHHMMRHVIDIDRVDEIDFGGGTSTYKKWWMHEERKMVTLVSFNPKTARGLLCFTLFSASRFRLRLREIVATAIVHPWRRWRTRKPTARLTRGAAARAR